MNAEPVTMRRLGIGIAVAAALLTSACAAGQQASTANEQNTIDGVNTNIGAINLRAALVEAPTGTKPYYPVGSAAVLKLVVVNTGSQDDRLVSITSPAITSWGAYATTADADAVLSAASPKRANASPSGASSSGASPSGASPSGASSSSTTTAAPLPSASTSIVISPGSRVSWGTPEAKGTLLLLSLTRKVYPGTTIPLTFSFARAGSVTAAVPIGLSISPPTSVIPEPSTSSIEG